MNLINSLRATVCSDAFLVKLLVWLSLLPIALWIISMAIRRVLYLFNKLERTTASYKRQLLIFSGVLLSAIFCFKFAIGLGEILLSPSDHTLTLGEELVNSFIYSLRIFGVDDSFDVYVTNVREMLGIIFGIGTLSASFFAVYACILSAIAPVAGGAIIFEIIASIFPVILVWLLSPCKNREKYYFSDLNDNTLALIRSINEEHKSKLFRKPVMIITDSYIDDDSEASVELVNEAKLLGAICVKNDIVHIAKSRKGNRKFFLINDDEKVNIRKLIELTERLGPRYADTSEFYPFVHSEIYNSVAAKVKENLGMDTADSSSSPFVIPINGYRNMILNMFSDVPLFEPIVHQYAENRRAHKDTELNVTIFGTGQIGTEMFLGTYWCGQMLGCKLHVTVISRGSEDEFESKINYLNPEILKSGKAQDPILQIYRDEALAPRGAEKYSDPYFTYEYISKDVEADSADEYLTNLDIIKKTNYFFVALGSDDENINMANKLRSVLGNSHLQSEEFLRTVIAYVVFDSSLCNALNMNCFHSYTKDSQGKKRTDIYMKALGSIEELYSVRNVFLEEFRSDARGMHERYYTATATANRKDIAQKIAKDVYSYSSSVARRVHRKYKVFSSGLWNRSVFDYCEEYESENKKDTLSTERGYKKLVSQYLSDYKSKVKEYIAAASGADTADVDAKEKATMYHDLAWLEHRRWNAYMRSCGFRGSHITDASGKDLDPRGTLKYIARFLEVNGAAKNLELKRHLCIVEWAYGVPIMADVDACGKFSNFRLWEIDREEDKAACHPDMLDELMIDYANIIGKPSEEKKKKFSPESKRYDYKQYDYPTAEF